MHHMFLRFIHKSILIDIYIHVDAAFLVLYIFVPNMSLIPEGTMWFTCTAVHCPW